MDKFVNVYIYIYMIYQHVADADDIVMTCIQLIMATYMLLVAVLDVLPISNVSIHSYVKANLIQKHHPVCMLPN